MTSGKAENGSGIKRRHYIILKGSILQEDMTILNKASKCTEQNLIELQEKIDKPAIIVKDFTPLF